MTTVTEPRRPGDALRAILSGRRLRQAWLARRAGTTRKHISLISTGHCRITVARALMLEDALGVPAEYWLNLQMAHDLWELRAGVFRAACGDAAEVINR